MKFDKPTLLTVTGPTCSGKTHLLHALLDKGFDRVVSTTTRQPRDQEREGVDYFFITPERSEELEKAGAFAELVTFRGTRYGVTHEEMTAKMKGSPAIILEPQGVAIYERYCDEHDWSIFTVYVDTTEELQLQRLNNRAFQDVRWAYTDDRHTWAERDSVVKKIIAANTDRAISITGEERTWFEKGSWNVIVPGDNLPQALADIEIGIKWRNYQSAPQST